MAEPFRQRPQPNMPEINIQITSRMVYMVIGAVAVLWLLSGIYFVGQQETGVVRVFGEFYTMSEAGAHWMPPWPIGSLEKPKTKETKRIEIGFRTVIGATATRSAQYDDISQESLMLTGDENIIDIDVIIQYRISDPRKYLFNIRNHEMTIRTASEAAIRYVVGQSMIDDALTEGKTEIQNLTQEHLQQILDSYESGILVTTVKLQDVKSPDEVIDAFKDVSSAIQDKERLINEAQGYRNDVIPRARGEAEQIIRQAEAFKEQRIRQATGEADRFNSILKEYRSARDVTKRRLYIEAMEAILPGMEKYIIESDGSGGVFNLLNLGKGGGQ